MMNIPHGSAPMAALLLPHGPWAIERVYGLAQFALMRGVTIQAHLGGAQVRSGYLPDDDEERPYELRDGVAMLSLTGPMTKGWSSWGGGTSTAWVRRLLRHAAADPKAKSVLIRIDSPGGSVAGTDDLARDVAQLGQRKPIDCYVEDSACSAAYWVASQCRRIYSNPTALVGSIGTYLVLEDWSRWYADRGIEVIVLSTGPHKGAAVEGVEITPEQRAEFQRVVDDLNAHFLTGVARGRRMSQEAVLGVATGQVWVSQAQGGGPDALSLGLVDRVCSIDDCLADVANSHPAARSGVRADTPVSGEGIASAEFDDPADALAAEAAPDDAPASTDADAPLRRRLADATTQARLTLATLPTE